MLEVFKVFTLNRYFLWSIEMRQHYRDVGKRVSSTVNFWDDENAGRAFMYLSYWYAGLYVVCEGWKEIKLVDAEIDNLLLSSYLDVLRQFRNGVYHYQADYFDKRIINALILGKDFDGWVESLTGAFAAFFKSWCDSQNAFLDGQVEGFPTD